MQRNKVEIFMYTTKYNSEEYEDESSNHTT